jgi:hypothetical protein
MIDKIYPLAGVDSLKPMSAMAEGFGVVSATKDSAAAVISLATGHPFRAFGQSFSAARGFLGDMSQDNLQELYTQAGSFLKGQTDLSSLLQPISLDLMQKADDMNVFDQTLDSVIEPPTPFDDAY